MTRRALPLLAGAVGISAFGDMVAIVPIALHLQERSGSGVIVATLFVALWAPIFLLAGPAGLLVDRLEPRRVLVVAAVAQAVFAGVLAFTSGTVAIMVLIALVGAGAAVAQPAEFALVPSVAGGNARRANSYVETLRAVGFALGPLAGGFLAAAGGMKLGLLVDAASFVLLAVIAAALPSAPRVPRAGAVRERARDGIVFLGRDASLRLVLGVGFVSLLFMTASAPAEVFFAKDVLEAGDVGFGLLWGAWTVAMAVGGLVLSRRLGGVGVALLMIVVQSAGLAIPTLWLSLAFACALYLVGGAAHGTKNVLLRTLIHERVPAQLHGRAFAASSGLRTFAELCAGVGGGVLIVAIGARWTLFLAGALPFVAGLVGLALHARRRQVDEAPATVTV
jgi:Na+/melibiose symporter-like transporter